MATKIYKYGLGYGLGPWTLERQKAMDELIERVSKNPVKISLKYRPTR